MQDHLHHYGKTLLVGFIKASVLVIFVGFVQSDASMSGYTIAGRPSDTRGLPAENETRDQFCPNQLILTFPRSLKKREIERIKASLEPFVPVSIEPISRSDMFLFKSRNKELSTETFLEALTSKFQNNLLSVKAEDIPSIERDYVIWAEPNNAVDADNLRVEDKFWAFRQINALQPRNTEVDRDTIVAVLDHGIQPHRDLNNNLWRPKKTFSVTVGNLSARCDKNTTHGLNLLAKTSDQLCKPSADTSHGNEVAGVIGANGEAVGVAKTIQILPIKILNSAGRGCASNAIRAIDFIIGINQGMYRSSRTQIRIVNNSYGFDLGDRIFPDEVKALKESVERARIANLLLVASAGNNGNNISEICPINRCFPHYPASIDSQNLIAVAASDRKDNILSNSNRGATVRLAAPGVEVYTTSLSSHCYFSETSAAAPLASGAAAVVMADCPNLTAEETKWVLVGGGNKTNRPLASIVPGGRLDISGAIRFARANFPKKCLK